MKLKNVGDDYFGKTSSDAAHDVDSSPSLTLRDLINALREYEQRWLKDKYKWDDVDDESMRAAEESNKVGDIDEDIILILQLSRFTYNHFQNFSHELREFYGKTRWELKSRELGWTIVTSVKGYKIPLLF